MPTTISRLDPRSITVEEVRACRPRGSVLVREDDGTLRAADRYDVASSSPERDAYAVLDRGIEWTCPCPSHVGRGRCHHELVAEARKEYDALRPQCERMDTTPLRRYHRDRADDLAFDWTHLAAFVGAEMAARDALAARGETVEGVAA